MRNNDEVHSKGSFKKPRNLFELWVRRVQEEYQQQLIVGFAAFSVGVLVGIVLGRESKK